MGADLLAGLEARLARGLDPLPGLEERAARALADADAEDIAFKETPAAVPWRAAITRDPETLLAVEMIVAPANPDHGAGWLVAPTRDASGLMTGADLLPLGAAA